MESKVQAKLIKELEDDGWYVIKLILTNRNGIADLFCMHKDKGVKFIEVKTKKGIIAPLQKFRAKEIEKKTGIKTEFYIK